MKETLTVKEAHPNWTALPVEILHKTFSLCARNRLRDIALVCKSWTDPAQAVLYNTVKVYSLLNLKRFQNTMEHKPTLGKNVKSFSSSVPNIDEGAEESILTSLFSTRLPNLEYIPKYRSHLIPILNALIYSQLTHLKTLTEISMYSSDACEVANYTTCALLMRNRLDTLSICDNYSMMKEAIQSKPYFDRLYNNLSQFEKLSAINIRRDTHEEIQVLDYVVEACKTLEKITFDFLSPNDGTNPPPLIIDNESVVISRSTPRGNIKSIKGGVNAGSFPKVLSYIIHKFPQLQNLSLCARRDPLTLTKHHTIILMYQFLPRLDKFTVEGLRVHQNTIWDAIGTHWATKAKLGGEHIIFQYEEHVSMNQQCDLSINNENGSIETMVNYSHPNWNDDWIHIDFVENYGKYIGKLELKFGLRENYVESDLYDLPRNFMAHTIKHCINIKSLALESFVLRRFRSSTLNLSRKLSLDELTFRHCMIYDGVLEQMSLFMPVLKRFRLGMQVKIQPNDSDENPDLRYRTVDIVMPYTLIRAFLFEGSWDEHAYVKVYPMADQQYFYYRFDFEESDDNKFRKAISEDEFLVDNYHPHFYICCQYMPFFRFE